MSYYQDMKDHPLQEQQQPQLLDSVFNLPAAPTRADIERLEAQTLALVASGELQAPDIVTNDHWAPHAYGRSVVIPAGTFVTGAVHKHGHLNVVVGDCTAVTDRGELHLSGINVFESQPGDKRAVFAHADTFWLTFHPNPSDVRDHEAAEDAAIEDSHRLATRNGACHIAAEQPLKKIA